MTGMNATSATAASPRIVVIGAGLSGALMGMKLLERGFDNFVILEKADRMGGTWRDNVYPGVACDVPAHLYVYSFAPNPDWRSRFADGRSLWDYYHGVAEQRGVLPYIEYGKEVASAVFEDDRWRLETTDGTTYEADIVISAVGRLHHPAMPDIPGMENYAGKAMHTARWDETVDLKGKRLGLIGTGSTATQIISATVDSVSELKLFQRTAQWVYPIVNTPIPWWKRLWFRLSPEANRRFYYQLQAETAERGRAAVGDATQRAARDEMCRKALMTVKDPVLRAKLTPDYEPGCKRLVMSQDFYEAVQKPNVEVVTQGIDHIETNGVVTKDGRRHEVDVLVYATGFDAHAFLRPMTVTGENGVTLDEVWAEMPLSYRTLAIPHMPNLIVINGPYSPGGNASVVGIVEVQVNYAMRLIERIVENDVVLSAREDAAHMWLDEVRERARKTVWGSGGCQSWYLDKTGTPNIDPTPLDELSRQLATPVLADYNERPRRRGLKAAA